MQSMGAVAIAPLRFSFPGATANVHLTSCKRWERAYIGIRFWYMIKERTNLSHHNRFQGEQAHAMRRLAILMLTAAFAILFGGLHSLATAAPGMTSQAMKPTAIDAPATDNRNAINTANDHLATPRQTAPITRTLLLTDTVLLTDTGLLTGVAAIRAATPLTIANVITDHTPLTATPGITTTLPITGSPPITGTEEFTNAPASGDEAMETPRDEVLEGTILVNRTASNVRFFVEGETYQLDAGRSVGLDLPRLTAVLNLYNCDANTPETEASCYWDPYLIDQNGFYEIVTGAEEGLTVDLTLREVGAPPANQVWIQNRSGTNEVVVYRNQNYEIAPSAIQEFSVEDDELPTFFIRSCVEANGENACEWAPAVVEAGFYYALNRVETAGGVPGSTVVELTLLPIAGEGQIGAEEVAKTTPPQLTCRLQVPALNVRSGPGLEYLIVSKVRSNGEDAATVLVEGRDEPGQWLAVNEHVAPGGWITASPNYITCDGDISLLPVVEIKDGRLAPTPVPAATPAPAADEAVGEAAPGDGETGADAGAEPGSTELPTAPAGLALLQVRNGFDRNIRFTLDQKFRPEPGPSEYDLKPGEELQITVYPGIVAFSVSSPWNGLSDNAEVMLEEDESKLLWLTFTLDPDGSGNWNLQF